MATLNVIRRWALRDQMSIREIARRTGLARNTVKKYLRSDDPEPRYARRVSSSKLDPYAEKLATWLGIEATKSRKQRRTLRQIHTLGRFPFAKTRVARSAYLRLMVEAHLNEIYILQERLEAMVKQVARAYRNDYLRTHIQQVATQSFTVVAESLKPVVRARGAHVHEARHTNLDIERLELIDLLKTSKDDVGNAIRKLQAAAVWDTHDRLKKQARNWNTGAAKVVEHVLVAIEAIVFEPDGDQLRFPRPAA